MAPPPLRRPVTLGELIEQLESIAEQLESDELEMRRRQRQKRYSNKEAIAQVAALAHREKLPETTAAMGVFLNGWENALQWVNFESLVVRWSEVASDDLDTDRVGVFWALLFLSSQGQVELEQMGALHGPIRLRRLLARINGADASTSLDVQIQRRPWARWLPEHPFMLAYPT